MVASLGLAILLLAQTKVQGQVSQVLIASTPLTMTERAPIWKATTERTPLKEGRSIRRFEVTLKTAGPVILLVEESILPDAHYAAMRPAFTDLRKNWRAGEPIDLAASENKGARSWLWNQLGPSEKARTSRFTLVTSKTLQLVSGGRTVSYELDTTPKLADNEYEARAPSGAKPPDVDASATPRPEFPARERHFYNRNAPTFLDEFEIQGEAAAWLKKRWRDMATDFEKEFADLYAAMEADRQSRERIPTPDEGTAFDDLPAGTKDRLQIEFENLWSQMGFENQGSAMAFLKGCRVGGTRTQMRAITGGYLPSGDRFVSIDVVPFP